ncbi:MAG TPA: tetratricopeptide repeat protein [Phycisphaerae bacterium]|nr:tetratricopeptide repeat protein [Phycisphaerae bacterium]
MTVVTETQPQPNSSETVQAAGRKRIWQWAVIFIIALSIRGAYLWQVHTIPFFNQPVGDAASYDAWARDIANGQWMGDQVFYQAPGYPYFLAVVYTIAGEANRLLAARLVQITLGSLACLLVGLATARLFSRGAGLLAACILALYPPAIFFDGLIQKASVNIALMALLVWTASHIIKRPGILKWLGLGAILGALGLTRENALALVPIVMIWVCAGFRSTPLATRARWFAGLCAGLFVVLFPVALRNHHVGGEWLITTSQAGPNFYIGNNAEASGRYAPLVPGHETPEFERADAVRLAESASGKKLSAKEVSQFWFSRSWDFIREAPIRWFSLCAQKFLLVINRYEISDVEGYNVYRDLSPMMSVLSVVGHFGILCPVAIAGMVLARANRLSLGVFVILPATFAISVAAFFVLARYRAPLVPMLIPFAAYAVVEVRKRYRERDSLLAPAVAVIIATIACNWPINPQKKLDAMAYSNLATTLAQSGNLQSAIDVWTIALEVNPAGRELHYNIGLAYLMQQDVTKAVEHFSTAKKIDPNLAEVDYQLGTIYEAMGQLDRAVWHFTEALRINPEDNESKARLANLQQKLTPLSTSPPSSE